MSCRKEGSGAASGLAANTCKIRVESLNANNTNLYAGLEPSRFVQAYKNIQAIRTSGSNDHRDMPAMVRLQWASGNAQAPRSTSGSSLTGLWLAQYSLSMRYAISAPAQERFAVHAAHW